jgi:hypothetical protein
VLYHFHCSYCGYEKRLSVNASPSVARAIGRRCDNCGEVWERNPVAEMAVDTTLTTVGEQITPYGILDPGLARRAESVERSGLDAVKACRYHTQNTVERCGCWSFARAFCWDMWRQFGKESAMGWRCDAIFTLLEREQHTKRSGSAVELDEYRGPVFSDGVRPVDYTENKLSK